jgi:dTDP-4-amino-4,6-dideoxygalactose transaminase
VIPLLDLRHQYEKIKHEIDKAIFAVINESAFVGGRYVQAFEERFAHYQQVKHCVGVGNGTDALEIALEVLLLPRGSEVLVPANSFIATAEAVTRSGHKVVFCDCDPDTYTLSVQDAANRVTPRTRAIIAVHLYGHPCDMEGIGELARKHDLRVVEDCAQAHGAEYKGKRVGGFSDIGTFSFYPGKNLGAYGDGGAIVTNDEGIAKKCRMIANHGRIDKYNHEIEGRNSRLDGLQAAILEVKLCHLDEWVETRRRVADRYIQELHDIQELILPRQREWARHAWHLFVIRTPKRDALQRFLRDNGIQSGIHYPISLPKLKAYSYLGQESESFFANKADSEILSLPMGEHLGESEIGAIARAVNRFGSLPISD